MNKFILGIFILFVATIGYATPPQILMLAHAKFVGSAPSMGACGTSPAVVGNDSTGMITVGTGGVATSCTLTFASTWTTIPHCFVSDESAIIATSVAPTATALVITASSAFSASSKLDYFCTNHQ